MKPVDWEQFVSSRKEGDGVYTTLRYRDHNFRVAMIRLCKKGYFKKLSTGYGCHFQRTNKPWVSGDAPGKAISYSFQH